MMAYYRPVDLYASGNVAANGLLTEIVRSVAIGYILWQKFHQRTPSRLVNGCSVPKKGDGAY